MNKFTSTPPFKLRILYPKRIQINKIKTLLLKIIKIQINLSEGFSIKDN